MAQVSSRRQITGLAGYEQRERSNVAESSAPASSAVPSTSLPFGSPSSLPSSAPSSSKKTMATIISRAVIDPGPSNNVFAQAGMCDLNGPQIEADITPDRRRDTVHRSNDYGVQPFRTTALEQPPGSNPEPIEFPKLPACVLQQAPEYEFSAHARLNVFAQGLTEKDFESASSNGCGANDSAKWPEGGSWDVHAIGVNDAGLPGCHAGERANLGPFGLQAIAYPHSNFYKVGRHQEVIHTSPQPRAGDSAVGWSDSTGLGSSISSCSSVASPHVQDSHGPSYNVMAIGAHTAPLGQGAADQPRHGKRPRLSPLIAQATADATGTEWMGSMHSSIAQGDLTGYSVDRMPALNGEQMISPQLEGHYSRPQWRAMDHLRIQSHPRQQPYAGHNVPPQAPTAGNVQQGTGDWGPLNHSKPPAAMSVLLQTSVAPGQHHSPFAAPPRPPASYDMIAATMPQPQAQVSLSGGGPCRPGSFSGPQGEKSAEDSSDEGFDAPPPNEKAVSLAQAAIKGSNGSAEQAETLAALLETMSHCLDTDGAARCPFPNCPKIFAKNRSYNLKTHMRSHSQLKPFACSSCMRAFSRKHDLERHARVHSGDKPYVCEVCQKGFPRSDALRRHWRLEKECAEKVAAMEANQSLSAGGQEGGSLDRLSQHSRLASSPLPSQQSPGDGSGFVDQHRRLQMPVTDPDAGSGGTKSGLSSVGISGISSVFAAPSSSPVPVEPLGLKRYRDS